MIRAIHSRSALLLGVAAAASCAVLAQPAAAQDIETVVVTGSLLHTDVNPSPLQTVSIDDINRRGLTSTADAIRSLSADSSGTVPTAFGIGFAAGSSGVALRGLTVNSTLVLINGRRTANYPLADDGERGFVDLNTLPLTAVDHVDVLKDGASSVYGADAIGGVVNIILRNQYQGAEGTVEAGGATQGGGFEKRASVMFGTGDLSTDHYNFYVTGEYTDDQHIKVGDRGFPFNTLDLTSIGGIDGFATNSVYAKLTPTILNNEANPNGGNSGAQGNTVIGTPTGTCGPLATAANNGTAAGQGPYCLQNNTLYGDDQPKQEKYGVYAHFVGQINSNTQVYLDGSYYQNNVGIDDAPGLIRTTVPTNTTAIALPAHLLNGSLNPNDPFAASGRDALISYYFGDIPGGAIEDNHVVRVTGGVKGVFDGWSYDAGLVFAHSWLNTDNKGFLNYAQLIGDIENGTYSFIDPSTNSPAVRAALAPDLTKVSTTDEDEFSVNASHDLFDLPGGTSQLGLGVELRHEATFDPDLNPGLTAQGLGIAHTIGNHNVVSVAAELSLPVFSGFEGDVSGRFDHYTDFGSTFNPKFGLKWQATDWLLARGTFSKGFRAPSFSENGSSAAEGFTTFSDLPAAFVAAHGGDEYTLPYSIGQFTTANPNIKPETSSSYTGGFVLTPLDWINASVDYYYIKKNNVIGPSSPTEALDAFFAGQPIPAGFAVTADAPDPLYPTAPLRPVVVSAPYVNADSLITDGIDLDIKAQVPLTDTINWTSELQATRILRYSFTFPGQAPLEYVGTQSPYATSSGAGTPRTRGSWDNSFTFGAISIDGTVYYVSGIQPITSDACGAGCVGGYPVRVPGDADAFWDFDLGVQYQYTDNLSFFANMKNVFDTSPPIDPTNYAGTNYNPTYAQAGIIGRFISGGIKIKE